MMHVLEVFWIVETVSVKGESEKKQSQEERGKNKLNRRSVFLILARKRILENEQKERTLRGHSFST